MALLSVDGVTLRFGGIVAVDSVSLDVAEGEIVGLIGPNGAGKTTVFNLITRLYRPESGEIAFTFQNVELFGSMTVLEHVLMGRHARRGRSARELIGYVGLAAHAHRLARELPYGQQKRVEPPRALPPGPPLLLLDE